MLFNKRGMSVGYTWVFGLVTIFGLGVLYIVFSQVFNAYLVPAIKNQVNSTVANIPFATQTVINTSIDKYMNFFSIMPFILFGVVIVYMFLTALRKEGESW